MEDTKKAEADAAYSINSSSRERPLKLPRRKPASPSRKREVILKQREGRGAGKGAGRTGKEESGSRPLRASAASPRLNCMKDRRGAEAENSRLRRAPWP